MIYLYAYLGAGIIALLIIFISHRLTAKPESEFTRDMMDALHPERKTWYYRLLENVVIPILAGTLVVIAWPAAVYMKVRELLFPEKVEPIPEKKEFAVARDDLLQKLSTAQVEERERIIDPMGAVPDVPFGHLNATWNAFKDNLESSDSVWAFSSQWETDWGRKEIREGYVVERQDALGSYLLTSRRNVEDD